MRPLRVSEDFVPVSEFKAQTAQWFRRADKTGGPVVVTQNGKPAGVLLSPRAFDALTYHARFVDAVNEGLADADAGRVTPHEEVMAGLRRRLKSRRK